MYALLIFAATCFVGFWAVTAVTVIFMGLVGNFNRLD